MKTLSGIIVSTHMHKTVVVTVTRRVAHPLYKKLVKKSKRYKVATGEFSPAVGDRVTIREMRPVSKDKHFKIVEVVGRRKAEEALQ